MYTDLSCTQISTGSANYQSGSLNPPILGGIRVQTPPELILLANLTIGNIVNSGSLLRPPLPPTLGGKNSKSPKVGGFRGLSAVLTMLRNNSPAVSLLKGDLGHRATFHNRCLDSVYTADLVRGLGVGSPG